MTILVGQLTPIAASWQAALNSLNAIIAANPPALWTPASLPAGTMWWDTEDVSSIVQSGGVVSSWTDRLSGVAMVAAGAAQPAYGATSFNGSPGLTFSGGQMLETSGAIAQVGQWSAMAVALPSSLAAAPVVDADSFTTNRIAQYLRYYGGAFQSISFNTSPAAFVANGPTPAVNVGAVLYAIQNGGSLTAFANDTTGTSVTTTGTPEAAAQNIAFGASVGNTGRAFYSGVMGDVVLSPTPLTTDQRQKLAAYEAWKFGLQASLDPSNPYLTRPPYVSDP